MWGGSPEAQRRPVSGRAGGPATIQRALCSSPNCSRRRHGRGGGTRGLQASPCSALLTTSRMVTCRGPHEGGREGGAALFSVLVRQTESIACTRDLALQTTQPPAACQAQELEGAWHSRAPHAMRMRARRAAGETARRLQPHRTEAVQQRARPHAAVHRHHKQQAQRVEAEAKEIEEKILRRRKPGSRWTAWTREPAGVPPAGVGAAACCTCCDEPLALFRQGLLAACIEARPCRAAARTCSSTLVSMCFFSANSLYTLAREGTVILPARAGRLAQGISGSADDARERA